MFSPRKARWREKGAYLNFDSAQSGHGLAHFQASCLQRLGSQRFDEWQIAAACLGRCERGRRRRVQEEAAVTLALLIWQGTASSTIGGQEQSERGGKTVRCVSAERRGGVMSLQQSKTCLPQLEDVRSLKWDNRTYSCLKLLLPVEQISSFKKSNYPFRDRDSSTVYWLSSEIDRLSPSHRLK